MEPPPPRPRAVTFLAFAFGFLGAVHMAFSLLLVPQTAAEFGAAGWAIGLALVASNVALLVGAVGLWWMRDWGRQAALAGVALRIAHGVVFAAAPGHEAGRIPTLASVLLLALVAGYLMRLRDAFE